MRSKLISVGLSLVIAVAIGIALTPTPAPATPTDSANSAFITKGFGCGVINGDGGGVFTPDGRISVVTNSGHTTLICKATGVANSTGRAVTFRNFGCGTFLGVTTNSQNTVSASGNVTLRCRI